MDVAVREHCVLRCHVDVRPDGQVRIRLVEATDGRKITKECPKKDWDSSVVQSKTIALTRPLGDRQVVLYDGRRVDLR
ncbi:hypothetical protein [Nonomuraea jabiensis]|uniref:hypothetical protein n=1 Tax=Nonomuraea jabiensis TaxID=882448 RepID=UPI0036AE6445